MRKSLTTCCFVLLVFISGCSSEKSFKGVKYSIINKSQLGSIKISYDVELEKKVSREFLKEFSLTLKNSEAKNFESVFILYYLPDMEVGSGAWASSHFTPNLHVEILGATIGEEQKLINSQDDINGEIIGKWLDDSYIATKCILIKSGEKYFLIRKYNDGSESRDEMVKKGNSNSHKFVEKAANSFGEYYQIESNGSFGVYDNEGFISSMKPIK